MLSKRNISGFSFGYSRYGVDVTTKCIHEFYFDIQEQHPQNVTSITFSSPHNSWDQATQILYSLDITKIYSEELSFVQPKRKSRILRGYLFFGYVCVSGWFGVGLFLKPLKMPKGKP